MIAAFPGCRNWTNYNRSPAAACAPSARCSPRTIRRKRIDFLSAYAECGNVSQACRLSMTSRSTHYHRLQNDGAYRLAFVSAHEEAQDRLLEEARRRAMGWKEPIVHQGKVVGYVERHSDRLLILLLQFYMPEKFGRPKRR
ncbi:hypothetical protein [Lacipirellula sp.]|uniref:hypothetical protein n=1 Tax=Lacipirellula sp. TaxID=2691419 RepID=UPI003D110083